MHSHVRIKCESVIMDVPTLRPDLAKVRHTHVRDNIHHLQASHMRIQHGEYYFLVSKGKTMPFGLNVTCSKQYDS